MDTLYFELSGSGSVQVRRSKNLKVQIRFRFKNLKPSIRLMFWYTATSAFFSKLLVVFRLIVFFKMPL